MLQVQQDTATEAGTVALLLSVYKQRDASRQYMLLPACHQYLLSYEIND